MKNFLLFSLLFVATLGAFAQTNITVLDDENTDISNSIINLEGGTSGEIVLEFKLHNSSSNTIDAQIELITISEVGGTINSLCVPGGCMMPGNTISPSFSLNPDEDTDGFSFHYSPFGNEGESSFRLKVFNQSNSNDTVNITVVFNATNSAVENAFGNTIVSDIYPNPASHQANIEYNLTSGSNLDIVVYDMLGKEVREYNLESAGILRMPLGDLEKGTYFCRYILDNEVVETQKLIIK